MPKVFISYSHDSNEHKAWVLQVAADLVRNGVEVVIDQWDLAPGQDTVRFMEAGIVGSDRVLMVCSDEYVTRAEGGRGGVGYERLIVTAELVQNTSTHKFIPLMRANASPRVPAFMGPRLWIDFRDDQQYNARLEELLRELHGVPAARPPLGPNPFSSAVAASATSPRAGSSGVMPSGVPLLDDDWFSARATRAKAGIHQHGLAGAMELRFALHEPLRKSQVELLEGVRAAEIPTFGWPIGVLLESRQEYRPRPVSFGIETEVAVEERALIGRPSYDYWAANAQGCFYLLQSLFEDQRREGKVFFDTRMVRVAESFMFCAGFYRQLGAPAESLVSFRVTHVGLRGRVLESANRERHFYPRSTTEDVCESELVVSLKEIHDDLPGLVRRVLEPLFAVFEFASFGEPVYEEIVSKFAAGRPG